MRSDIKEKNIWKFGLVMAILMIAFWGLNWFFLKCVWYPGENSNQGAFGDMFGAVNALFSGTAMIGVAMAVLYQRAELQEVKRSSEFERDIAISKIRPIFTLQRTSRANTTILDHKIKNEGETIFNVQTMLIRVKDKKTFPGCTRPIMRKGNESDALLISLNKADYRYEECSDLFQIKFVYVLQNSVTDTQLWSLEGGSLSYLRSEAISKDNAIRAADLFNQKGDPLFE